LKESGTGRLGKCGWYGLVRGERLFIGPIPIELDPAEIDVLPCFD
jgi:hypothetical protein